MLNRLRSLGRNRQLTWRNLRESAQAYVRQVRSGKLDPERFRRSIAVGILIGLLPIHGMQSVLWLGLCVVLPIEPMLTWLTSWIGNALTAVPITWLELQLGSLLCTGHFAQLGLEQVGDRQLLARLSMTLLV